MSRHLPQHPNLDHLKKQAKDLLSEALQRDPAAKLADAQHALAREYGFASWPKLKAHVEQLAGAAPPEKPSPLVGEWTANLSKSIRHPASQFRSARLQVEVVGDMVTISDVVVDESGRENRGKNAMRADGNEHPSERGNGYAMTATWRGSYVLETVARKDGEIVGRGLYEVSVDGRTLTVTSDQQRIVLDRV